ncbi:MAG: tyrosine-type recombinase/integrase [Candidatus Longimicrobiales bacterium M2_2A_002]
MWRDSDGRYHKRHAEGRRAYGDFRAYSDVGGAREALAPVRGDTKDGSHVLGTGWGTTDPALADALFDKRKAELKDKRAGRAGAQKNIGLQRLAAKHLRMKKAAGGRGTSEQHMEDLERRLRVAVEHFGVDRHPESVTPADVREWLDALAKRPNGRGGTLSSTTLRNYMWALSGLYGRAQEQGYVPPAYNPVKMLQEKPEATTATEAKFFEVPEAALILRAARVVGARSRNNATEGLYPIVATFLLTGGRKSEVLGLSAEDVSFDKGKIYFRPTDVRGLKTLTSHRIVPLWPQLREILHDWMFPAGGTPRVSGLLFPSRVGGMIGDLRKSLDEIGELVGLDEGDVRTKAFRHTYCSARLQTVQRIVKPGKDPATDEDAYEYTPVSHFTVQKEMGHGGASLVDRVYGHVGDSPHRSEVVEYKVENHRKELGERLVALEAK